MTAGPRDGGETCKKGLQQTRRNVKYHIKNLLDGKNSCRIHNYKKLSTYDTSNLQNKHAGNIKCNSWFGLSCRHVRILNILMLGF